MGPRVMSYWLTLSRELNTGLNEPYTQSFPIWDQQETEQMTRDYSAGVLGNVCFVSASSDTWLHIPGMDGRMTASVSEIHRT